MYVDGIIWFKYQILTNLCLIVLLTRFILIVDSAKPGNPSTSRQMCSKLQSMLSYGKYQTSQISSNITYESRIYPQNFLAYSSIDDLLIFVEPKHQIYVYNAQTIQLLVNFSTTDVVISTSTTSLFSDSHHDLFFIYETTSKTNLISLRVCQVQFNMFKFNFEDNYCIEKIIIQYDQSDLRIHGFTIKRDHAGTKKSLLFISTAIGLIYTIFDTRTGSLIGESTIMNETLNEGSIVLSSSGSIYYASTQEHLIYELNIARDFRLYYGKIIKTNAIKYPFGLITDECNHLYIATRSMILIMFVQTRSTIRSVFSIASDLPKTLERLNSTTYVYATIRKHSGKTGSHWMFNFLYFTDPERITLATRHPVVRWEEKLDFNNTATDNANIAIIWPTTYPLSSKINGTKKYIQFSSTSRKTSSRFKKKMLNQTRTTISIDKEISSIDKNKLFTSTLSIDQSISDLSDDFPPINPDNNLEIDDDKQFEPQEQINQSLDNEVQSETHSAQNNLSDPYSFSLNSSKLVVPVDNPQNDSQGRENLTLNQESQFTTSFIKQSSDSYLLSKLLNSTLTPSLNRTIDITETLFSEDDIQSYFQGRENLTSSQQAQIQAYLARQSSSNYNIFSKYSKTTNKPSGKFISDNNLPSDIEIGENLLINEDSHSQDYRSNRPLSDSKSFNRTIDIAGTIFSEEDIQSYLEGRGNFSLKQEAQIQAYVAKQSSSDYNIFSKYSKTTNKPREIFTSEDSLPSEIQRDEDTSTKEDIQPQDYVVKRPISDSKFLNHTINTEETIFSDEDVQSYLQGRTNLSTIQEAQIQAYLAKQLSSNHSLFSKYLTSTSQPTRIFLSDNNISSTLQTQDNASLIRDTQSEDSVSKLPPSDSKSLNRTIDIADTIFSEEEIQSYLEGRGNLSLKQEAQIQAYLAQKLSSMNNIFSKYFTSTKKPRETFIFDGNISVEFPANKSLSSDKNTQPEQPLPDFNLDYKRFNRTIDSLETIFSDEDLQSYLQGRGNLSRSQEAQIQAYLAKQSSSDSNIFSTYSKSTKPTAGIFVSHDNIQSKPQDDNNSSQNYLTKQPLSESDLYSEQFDRVTDSVETLISEDDLQSYLEGRSNLSASQETQIQAYLARQSSSYYNIFSKYSKSTIKPTGIVLPDEKSLSNSSAKDTFPFKEDFQSQNYSSHLNRTTDTDEILFSDEDLKSYLQGRANLSLAQEVRIQAYLARQSSSLYNLFSKYSTSTRKPRRTLIPDRKTKLESQREGNLSLTEDIQSEDYSEELLPSDSNYYNRTADSEEILFSEDDLRSYLAGRANLSKSQEAQIQAYLTKQSSSNQSIFSKYSRSTKLPTRIYTSDDNLHPDYQSEDTQSQNYLTKTPLFDSKYFNFTTDSEEILFSDDDVQSYLQGRGNLSLAQEVKIKVYLDKQTSLDNKTLSRYFTSTRKPTKILTYDDKWQIYSEGQMNRSLSEQIQSSESVPQKLTSTIPYTTRKRTRGRRPSQSIVNGSDDFDDSIEQFSDIYTDSNDDKNISIDTLDEYSQLSTSTSFISQIHTDFPGKPIKRPPTDRDGKYSDDDDDDTQESFDLSKDGMNRSLTSSNTSFEDVRVTLSSDVTKLDFTSDEKSEIDDPINRRSTVSSSDQLIQDISNANLTSFTLSSNDSSSLKDDSFVSQFNPIFIDSNSTLHPDNYDQQKTVQDDDDEVNLPLFPTKFKSTIDQRFSQITPRQSLSTSVESILLDRTPKPAVTYHLATDADDTSPDLVVFSHDNTTNITSLLLAADPSDTQIAIDQSQISSPKINDTTIPSIHQKITSVQNQSNLTDTSGSSDDISDRLDDDSILIKQTSTLSILITNDTMNLNTTSDYINNNIEDEISHKHSSPLSVDFNVSSTLHPSLPFGLSNTTLLPSLRSRLSSPLHHSLAPSSTESPKFTRFSSSKLFSEMIKTAITTPSLFSEITPIDSEPTTMLSYSTIFPSSTSKLQSSHQFSSMQTTDATITSNIPMRESITTLADTSSSPFTTHHPRMKSTITSTSFLTTDEESFTTKSDQYTSKSSEIHIETSSLPYEQSTEIFTTVVSSTNLDSSSTIMSDKTSSSFPITTIDDENLILSDDNRLLETTEILPISSTLSPSFTDKYQEELISSHPSFELKSTMFPHFYTSKILSTLEHTTSDRTHPLLQSTLPIMRRTSYPSTTSTITTTTERRYRTRKQKITRWQTQQSSSTTTTATTIPSYQTISIHDYKTTTSTETSIWHSEWNPLEQQNKFVIKPPLTKNDSNTVLTNDLLNKIFNNISTSTNSTSEKSIFLNLINLPPSSWNFSLNSTENIVLDIALPSPIYPSYSNTTTNLTFPNIEANSFSTNIVGIPINLQVDRVHTKQFSLKLNATDTDTKRNPKIQSQSDIIIGHVKSEQFELNLTKSDNMHVYVKQVDSATAELYLDSNFCTNESSLEINLNLSKNGTIRYGNRKPIHIGPVFTRVHMLKQSCDLEQPLTLFFDICKRQNPCINGGTCLSVMPNYDDRSYVYTEVGHVGYKCDCPLHVSGDYCQYLQYPLGYCLNGGTLFQINDRYNKSIEKCICPIGFSGENCEENIDNCIGIDCSDHGICEDGIEMFKCSCFDGYYGFNCERTNVQTVLLQAASRSFGVVAILLIASIAGLFLASDIHTYLTRKKEENNLLNQIPRRVTSELFENSILLLGFRDAPIEMNDLSNVGTKKKLVTLKPRQTKRTTRNRRPVGYRQFTRRRPLTPFSKTSSRRYLVSNQTIL